MPFISCRARMLLTSCFLPSSLCFTPKQKRDVCIIEVARLRRSSSRSCCTYVYGCACAYWLPIFLLINLLLMSLSTCVRAGVGTCRRRIFSHAVMWMGWRTILRVFFLVKENNFASWLENSARCRSSDGSELRRRWLTGTSNCQISRWIERMVDIHQIRIIICRDDRSAQLGSQIISRYCGQVCIGIRATWSASRPSAPDQQGIQYAL